MLPYAAPPPPKPAQQQIVVEDTRANAQPLVIQIGSGGKRTFANRHERRHYMSLVRRELRKRWRQAEHSKLNALIIRHHARLAIARELSAIQERAASLARLTPVNA
jgi:hypothetical protein